MTRNVPPQTLRHRPAELFVWAQRFSSQRLRLKATTPHRHRHGLRTQALRHVCGRRKIATISRASAARQHQRQNVQLAQEHATEAGGRRALLEAALAARVRQGQSHTQSAQKGAGRSICAESQTSSAASTRVAFESILCAGAAKRPKRHGPTAFHPTRAAGLLHAWPGASASDSPTCAQTSILFAWKQHVLPSGPAKA